MEYRTSDGIEFFCLPSGARCTYTRKHPDNMNTCPKDDGYVCIPDECGYYKEYTSLDIKMRAKHNDE